MTRFSRVSGRDGRSGGGAHRHVLRTIALQPLDRSRGRLLVRVEVAAQVLAPRPVSLAHEAALAEQIADAALPRAPLPQRAVRAQVERGLAQRVPEEDRGDPPEPLDAPLLVATERLVHVEGGRLVLGLFGAVPE